MYWICFGESAKGCLSVARHRIAPDMPKEKIIALLDDYTQGDIRNVGNRAAREDILFPWQEEQDADPAWMRDYIDRHWEAFGRLDEVDKAVIWAAGGNAVEQCGLRYVVSRLYERRVPVWLAEVKEIPLGEIKEEDEGRIGGAVSVVTGSRVLNFLLRFVPQPLVRRYAAHVSRRVRSERAKEGRVRYSGVGEMDSGAARYFYRRRRLLTETEQGLLLTEWKRMQEENAPLRVMASGRPRSAAIDFYDEAILACVSTQERRAALTVGKALVKLAEAGDCVSDMMIFSRIRALGAAGRLEIVRYAPTYRDMTIRKIRS